MIDGIKFIVYNIDPNHWQGNPYLSPNVVVKEETGEIVGDEKFIYLNGLRFSIRPHKDHPGTYFAEIKGSLHRWANDGGNNSNDFSFARMEAAILELCTLANVAPHLCIIRNLEFGVNILVPMPAAQFLTRIICLPNRPFLPMTAKDVNFGKELIINELKLKTYDKGKQIGNKINNLLRLEVATEKMRPLKKANIETLADLLDPRNLSALGVILFKLVADIITDEPGLEPKNQGHKERWEEYRNPINWAKMERRKRSKAKMAYRRFVGQYLPNPPIYCALLEVRKTWAFLLNVDHKRVTFPPSENAHLNEADIVRITGKGDISTFKINCGNVPPSKTGVIEGGENAPIKPLKNNYIHSYIFAENPQTIAHSCRGCGRDLSAQKSGSHYCRGANGGRACRNLARDQRRRSKAAYEVAALDALELDHLGNLVLYFAPGYTPPPSMAILPDGSGAIRYRGQWLHPCIPVPAASIDRATLPNLWPLVRVDVLSLDEGRPVLSFTATRAKRFARSLIQQNKAKTPGKMHIDSA